MPLLVPNLDDRRWADLVQEARSLIPGLAPAWTDHNVHDPGITFIELFAWLAEMQMYQINRVGARQREAFARLAGLRRRPRRPARVEIEVQGHLREGVFLPACTRLSPVEGDELVFETASDLWLTRSRLVRVEVDDGARTVDQTKANDQSGVSFLAFGEQGEAGAKLRLGFDALHPETEPEIRLAIDLVTDDLGALCVPADPAAPSRRQESRPSASPVTLAWEYQGAAGRWSALDLRDDGTFGFSQSGVVTLGMPGGPFPATGRVWIRCRIAKGSFDIEPRVRRIGLNRLPCVQRETVRDELLGIGNGLPDQSFVLSRRPLLSPAAQPTRYTSADVVDWDRLPAVVPGASPGGFRVTAASGGSRAANRALADRIADLNLRLRSPDADAAESSGNEERDILLGRKPVVVQVGGDIWRQTPSLEDAPRKAKQFAFDLETGRVDFGNGLNGQVPEAGQRIVALWYRASAGGAGNVGKDLHWKFLDAGVPGVTLTNPLSASGGADPETLDELELRARARLIEPRRAVTLRDFEALALETPGVYVARAKAIPNCPSPDSITVAALSKARPGRGGRPKPPSDAFLASVRRQLERYRLLGDDVRVVPPVFVEVRVSVKLRLARGAGPVSVEQRARSALDAFLAGELEPTDQAAESDDPTARAATPPGPCPTRWPFGRAVYPSEVYAILDGVPGVDAASGLVLAGSSTGGPIGPDTTGAIRIPPIGLVYPGPHRLSVDADAPVTT